MTEITVRLRCPVDPNDSVGGAGVVLSRWLPLSEDDWFDVMAEGVEFRVWFDEGCVGLLEDLEDVEIERRTNISLDTILLDATIQNISDRMAQFIYEESDRPQRDEAPPETEEYRELRDQYEELGKRVHRGAIQTRNRILDYFRVQKGQFRLGRYELDPRNTYSFFVMTRAKVEVNGEWVRWCPATPIVSGKMRILRSGRYLTEDEWPELIEFVRGPQSTPAVLDFLSRAEALAAEGYDRSAIVEAVSALETALYDFAQYPDREQLDAVSEHAAAHRIDFDMLQDLIENKLGLRGSLGYLLPVLLPVEQLPDETLEWCRKANAVRVNVVHNQQRSIDEDELRGLLSHLRDLCEILLDLTSPPEPPVPGG